MHETSTVPCINDGNDFTKSGQHGALSLTSVFCLCFPVWRESGPDMFFRADGSRLCCCAIKFSFRMVKKCDSRCPCLRSLRRCCRLGSPIARSRLNGIFLKFPFLRPLRKVTERISSASHWSSWRSCDSSFTCFR